MKCKVSKKDLIAALKKVEPAVSNRSTLPILSGVHLQAADTRLAIETTDLEFSVRLQMRADSEPGNAIAVVPSKILAKAVAAMPEDEVTLDFSEDEGRQLTITSGTKSIAIDGFPATDWPQIVDGVDWKVVCELDSEALANALSRVVLCASTDEARPVLTGAQFGLDNKRGVAELVATDSYRLGVASVEAEFKDTQIDDQPIVPARVLKHLAKQLSKDGGKSRIYVGRNGEDGPRFIEFTLAGAASYVIRQIEGEFPNWKNIVPPAEGGELRFDSKELSQAVKEAAALRSDKNVPVKIELGNDCLLKMSDAGSATLCQTLEKSTYSPNGAGPMVIAFNPRFVLDAIDFLDKENANVFVTDSQKPAVFTSGSEDRYVLMPVRLPN